MQVFLSMETVTEVSWSHKGHLKLVASGSRCSGSVWATNAAGVVRLTFLGPMGLRLLFFRFPWSGQ